MKNNKKTIQRIGIDARFYGPIGKGLGRYTEEIADHIIKLDRENEYVIFLGRENFNEFKTNSPKVKKVLVNIKWYGLAEQILFPFYIRLERVNLMHFPHFNAPVLCPTKFIVTIHDLILLKFPTRRASTLGPAIYALKNFFYKIVIKIAVIRAKKILTVSQYTKNDLIGKFKVRNDKIAVTYEGVADLNNPPLSQRRDRLARLSFSGGGEVKLPDEKAKDQNVLSYYHISKPFLLYVGNAYPHKNLESLIKVILKIKKQTSDISLVLVGKEDYFYRRLKESLVNLPADILFPGYVPDNDLKILYAKALAYVFPSLYEGFGLPALEAMSFGLPVASSNKSCLPEILGSAAIYFNPEDEKEMKEKIELVIKDEPLRQDLIKRGLEQVKKYSWNKCAEETLEVYRNVLRLPRGN